jgi:molybdopterin-containing oxidoreductase family membrane subunit
MARYKGPNLMAVFPAMDGLIQGIHALKQAGHENFLVYAPVPHHDIEHALHRPRSPVRVFTLIGGLTGFATGWALTIGSAMHYPLIVGGKPIISIPPFGVLAYILTILFGALATMIGFLLNARLPQLRLAAAYDERLSSDHYGVQVFCEQEKMKEFEKMLKQCGATSFRKSESL